MNIVHIGLAILLSGTRIGICAICIAIATMFFKD